MRSTLLCLSALTVGSWFAVLPSAQATLIEPVTIEQQTARAAAICRATVVGEESFVAARDGGIYTRTFLRVDEVLKGRFPAVVAVVHAGGRVGSRVENFSDNPRLQLGNEHLLFLGRRADGTLFARGGPPGARRLQRAPVNGKVAANLASPFVWADESALGTLRVLVPVADSVGEDVTSQAAAPPPIQPQATTGLFTTNGYAARFLAQDRGEAIEYFVDAQALPASITLPQALNSVSNAFNAWSAVTSLKFKFLGLTNFGMAASSIDARDSRIRLQLHDLFNAITDSVEVLGRGGNSFYINAQFPVEGTGGRVGTNEFFEVSDGSLVMSHTQSAFTNLLTFEEVLAHEIGHILSLVHSSENIPESNALLQNALMYYQVHADGRGAQLSAYELPLIRQAYPPQNTPPFGFDRVMDIVTDVPANIPNIPGINRIEKLGYDLQTTNLTLMITNSTAVGPGRAGDFSVTNSTLYFTPLGPNFAPRLDPAVNSDYGRVFVRISDGTNASPYYLVRVISLQIQQNVTPPNGLGVDWVTNYFGSPSASVDPTADADGDGISNRDEFRLGTDPTNSASALRITSRSLTNVVWTARPYDLYEVQTSTNLVNWSRLANPVLPVTTNGSLTLPATSAPRQFLRVLRVP